MIKTGTIGLVSTIKSKRKWLTKGIQIIEGSMWNHAFLVLEIDGQLVAYEEGTIHGITITPLSEYFRAEKTGECLLCFKNLKDYNPELIKKQINDYSLSLVGKNMYAWWQILLQIPRQLLQRVGINWTYKSKGYVCSVIVAHVLDHFFSCFPDWNSMSPDDLHKSENTVFIQH